jgi:hypothetical protein
VTSVEGTTAHLDGVVGRQVRPWAAQGVDREVPSITSNTEGTIVRVTVGMEFDHDASLSVGDVVMVQGSFSRQQAPSPVEFR